MSYTIDITKEPMSDDEVEAWNRLEELRLGEESREYGSPPGDQFLPLYEKLVSIYPCIATPEGENSPWSDGPLKDNFGLKNTVLGMSFSRVDDALPIIVKTATEMGFTVFDAQDGKIHRPVGWAPARKNTEIAPASPATKQRAWWKIW